MNIAFDSGAIQGSSDRGIGKYTACQLNTMVSNNPEEMFYYFNFSGREHVGKYLNKSANLKEIMIFPGENSELLRGRYNKLFGLVLKGYLRLYAIDFYYITSPFDMVNTPLYRKEWFEGVPVGGTFYDLIPYIFKDKYLKREFVYNNYMNRVNMIKWMNYLFPISESAGDDLVKYLEYQRENIAIIYGAPDEHMYQKTVSEAFINRMEEQYGIKRPYIICVGGADYRKNIDGLIAGYASTSTDIINNYQLVIVGKLPPTILDKYKFVANISGVSDRVIFTGFISDEDLLDLYNGASLCAFTSLYEGYGMPVIEAYKCGLTVVSSNNSSLKEVAGDAAFVVDPYDNKSIAEGIIRAINATDEEISDRKDAAVKILETFTWERTAELTIKVIRDCYGKYSNHNLISNEDVYEPETMAEAFAMFAAENMSTWTEESKEKMADMLADICG